MQRTAKLAFDDQTELLRSLGLSEDFADQTLRRLSSLGRSGTVPGNVHRDLVLYLGEPSTPKTFKTSIHVQLQKGKKGKSNVVSVNMSFLLPHEYFNYLYTKRRSAFDSIILGGDPNTLPSFWQGVQERNDPRFAELQKTSVVRKPDWMKKAVPLSIHGDAVPVIQVGKPGTKSLEVVSHQSVVAVDGSSLLLKQPVCAVFEQSKVKSSDVNTDNEIGQVLLWSYKALQDGHWPAEDHRGRRYDAASAEGQLAGQALAGGFCGVLYLIKSDLDFLAKSLGLRHYGANEPCDICRCNKAGPPDLWPTNFRDDSGWVNALFTTDEWRALYEKTPHWVFELQHLSQHNVEGDELHIIWLGTASWTGGSVIWMLVFRVMAGSATTNMEALWAQITQCYSEFGTSAQYSSLTMSSFCEPKSPSSHYPKLKGKAAEVKSLSAVLRKVWAANMNPESPEHKLVLALLDNQLALQRIIDEHAGELFLASGKADELLTRIKEFLLIYTKLGHYAGERGDLLWNMTPKFHWLYHLGQRARYMSPRRAACWLDEDYVGKCKKVAHACAPGTPLHQIPSNMLEKMRWGLDQLHAQRCK